jgi:predicted nucleic acid-binding protein
VAGHVVLDTNVYIRALREPDRLSALKRFVAGAGARLRVHAVVALELRVGARTPRHEEAVAALLGPYVTRQRVVVPSFEAFVQAGRVLASLSVNERVVLATAPPSLTNDALLAASCREEGVLLLTENHRDFAAIRRHLRGFRFTAPDELF